jgi:hypothetical protein
VSAANFHDWKRHPVTQQIMSQLKARVEFMTEELIDQTAYMSQSEMAEKAGAIKALRDVLNVEYEGEDSDGN